MSRLISAERVKFIEDAADMLDREEHRYVERFNGDCPKAPIDLDGTRIPHGDTDCDLCGGTDQWEDDDAPWVTPLIEGLRLIAADLRTVTDAPRVLPQYTDRNARCAKCGHNGDDTPGISTHFGLVPTPEQLRPTGPTGFWLVVGADGPTLQHEHDKPRLPSWMEGTLPEQEFLARCCQRCGYTWIEAPLDDPGIALAGLQ